MSRPEWAASDNTPSDPDRMPAASLSKVIAAAASMECSETRRFSAEKSGGMETADVIAFLDYKRSLPGVQPGNPECIRLPCALHRSEEHTSELQSLRHLVCR